jgi:hypothetical protein
MLFTFVGISWGNLLGQRMSAAPPELSGKSYERKDCADDDDCSNKPDQTVHCSSPSRA